jgi:hypothetical protein
MSAYERMRFDRFEFRGLHGCDSICSLEIIPVQAGRTVVIATELKDNFGTSITNVAEHLASHACDRFEIDPDKLIWIETYGYSAPGERQRTFDLVTFTRKQSEKVQWSPAVLRCHPDGWPGYFTEPTWRPMNDEDWRSQGLNPRSSGF